MDGLWKAAATALTVAVLMGLARGDWRPSNYDSLSFRYAIERLKDLKAKLVIAGFTNYPYGEDRMRCQECMYYLVHRRWCDLPELALPVKADWWCRLWRI